ncbi:Uncharacterised protein [Vibrio cholerae]|nr:Uncharacterised protein [Vibrio cholerae]
MAGIIFDMSTAGIIDFFQRAANTGQLFNLLVDHRQLSAGDRFHLGAAVFGRFQTNFQQLFNLFEAQP